MPKIDREVYHKKKSNDLVNKSLGLLRVGDFKKASELFSTILRNNYSNLISESGLKCAKYWDSRMSKINQVKSTYEKGKLLIDEWKKYESFVTSIKNLNSRVFSNIQFFVFNLALEALKNDLNNSRIDNLQLNYMIALSYKKIGDFNNAIEYFEKSLYLDSKNANILAQMADCYALIDNERRAKVLFKEAFFIDSASIDIKMLDSNMIETLIAKIEEQKVPLDEIKYWIPVYGRIYEVFNVSREILPAELGQLKQKIFNYEKLFDDQQKNNYIKAILLNAYLWFYDYLCFNKTNDKIIALNSVKRKINNISNKIYEELIKKTGVSR